MCDDEYDEDRDVFHDLIVNKANALLKCSHATNQVLMLVKKE